MTTGNKQKRERKASLQPGAMVQGLHPGIAKVAPKTAAWRASWGTKPTQSHFCVMFPVPFCLSSSSWGKHSG